MRFLGSDPVEVKGLHVEQNYTKSIALFNLVLVSFSPELVQFDIVLNQFGQKNVTKTGIKAGKH